MHWLTYNRIAHQLRLFFWLKTGDIVYEVDVATAHTKGFFSMSDTVHNVKCVYQARYIISTSVNEHGVFLTLPLDGWNTADKVSNTNINVCNMCKIFWRVQHLYVVDVLVRIPWTSRSKWTQSALKSSIPTKDLYNKLLEMTLFIY